METNYIEKYFESSLANLSKHLNNANFPANEKDKLKIRIELINEFKEKSDIKVTYQTQKQALRIQNLAMLRKTKALPELIGKQKLAIRFCDLITTCLPYVEAFNPAITKPISELCNGYKNKIDLTDSIYMGNWPDREEIEQAFKPYFENTALSKYDIFKEGYQKIEYLYKELKAIVRSK